jgi:competence protein ComGC
MQPLSMLVASAAATISLMALVVVNFVISILSLIARINTTCNGEMSLKKCCADVVAMQVFCLIIGQSY